MLKEDKAVVLREEEGEKISVRLDHSEENIIQEALALEQLCNDAEELQKNSLSKKDLISVLKKAGIKGEVIQKAMKEGLSSLPIPFATTNLEKTLEGIYILAQAKKKTPYQILRRFTFSDDLEISSDIKRIYYEAITVHEDYRMKMRDAGLSKETEWHGFFGCAASVGSTYLVYTLAQYFFWDFFPAVTVAVTAGTALGLGVRRLTRRIETWYHNQEKACAQQDAKVELMKERDKEMTKLQQELTMYLFVKDE